MYLAARKGYPHDDYVFRATARGEACPAPSGMRSDWLDEYAVDQYRRTVAPDAAVTRELLLHNAVRITVSKGRCGGGPERLTGPDVSRLSFTVGNAPASPHPS
ncbi:hypothetical protein OG897_04245 [Streptomyces sp. NBC_00237]|uniref:hypothetical protein n=1 Tax=Streptomyces sp. NBC_00237 TaxID=2975687 RepID=UPI00225634A8|nr:hypothetical protein [Streptomyces sp. NBC_00237]MCX5200675.1 hypothetical protein [Streptomyces sp. NBC_00237]